MLAIEGSTGAAHQWPHRTGFEAPEPGRADADGHDGSDLDLARAVGDGRAMERHGALAAPDGSDAPRLVELEDRPDERGVPHRDEVVLAASRRHGHRASFSG